MIFQTAKCEKVIPSFSYCAALVGDNVWVGQESAISVFNSNVSTETCSMRLHRCNKLNHLQHEVVQKIDVPGNVVMSLCVDPNGQFVWGSTTDRKTFVHIWNAQVRSKVMRNSTNFSRIARLRRDRLLSLFRLEN
jgi:hypothetical protein